MSNASSLDAAIRYIDSKPAPLEGADLDALARRAARALAHGTIEGTGMPRFNASGDKALVNLDFLNGDDELIYTATFRKIGGVWVLRGAGETSQGIVSIIH